MPDDDLVDRLHDRLDEQGPLPVTAAEIETLRAEIVRKNEVLHKWGTLYNEARAEQQRLRVEVETLRALIRKLTLAPVVDPDDGHLWVKNIVHFTPEEADVVRRCEQ